MPELDVLLTQANADAAAGRSSAALQGYRRALALAPANAQLHHNVGVLLAQAGDDAGAERHFLEAERLHSTSPASSLALGHLWFRRGRVAHAAQAFERALRRAPDSLEATCNLGLALQAMGESARAWPLLMRARAALPLAEPLLRAHFEALQAVGEREQADRVFMEYAAAAPPSAWLVATGLHWARTGAHPQLEGKYLQLALSWRYDRGDLPWLAAVLDIVQYFDAGRDDIASLYRTYNALMQASLPRAASGAAVAAPGPRLHGTRTRLRIGYLSSDFRRHVMGELMLEVFRHHDRRQFEVLAYSLAPAALEDALTARFGEHCDGFVRLAALDDAQAAQRIGEDELDLLVDLASRTPQARPGILLRKPAPVIVGHLGDHGTIGLEQVDFKLTDDVADVPDAVRYQIERPLVMRGCVMPFRRIAPSPPDGLARARLGIPADAVVFGAFAPVLKFSPRCLDLWRRILHAVPGAYLALSPFTNVTRLQSLARMAASGIARERIVVIQPSADAAVNRARYRCVDVLLDTLPYTGGDSTVAALDMGVPVVTLSGERQAERMGLSILSHLGVVDTVARSDDEYVAIATRLATDLAWRRALSARILERIESSGIADLQRYTRNLEDAYRRALAPTAMMLNARVMWRRRAHPEPRHLPSIRARVSGGLLTVVKAPAWRWGRNALSACAPRGAHFSHAHPLRPRTRRRARSRQPHRDGAADAQPRGPG